MRELPPPGASLWDLILGGSGPAARLRQVLGGVGVRMNEARRTRPRAPSAASAWSWHVPGHPLLIRGD